MLIYILDRNDPYAVNSLSKYGSDVWVGAQVIPAALVTTFLPNHEDSP